MEKLLTKKQIDRRIRKIKKHNRLYVNGAHGSLIKLDTVSPQLYDFVVVYFAKKHAELFRSLNAGITHHSQVKAVIFELPQFFESEFKKLYKGISGGVTVFRNTTLYPIMELRIEAKKKEKEEK